MQTFADVVVFFVSYGIATRSLDRPVVGGFRWTPAGDRERAWRGVGRYRE